MGDQSRIEWTDATWNPVVGCSIVSPGCTNCYAMATAHGLERRFGSAKYGGLTKAVNGHPVWTGQVRLAEEALDQPLRWRRGRRIFVNSMSDLFHEGLPDAAIDRVFAVMALCPQHTFQILTKRVERMRDYIKRGAKRWDRVDLDVWSAIAVELTGSACAAGALEELPWPLPNVWLGVSVEDQARADERIPLLLETPAAKRFLSCEPLLGPVRILGRLMAGIDPGQCTTCGHGHGFTRCPNTGGIARERTSVQSGRTLCSDFRRKYFAIDWVIAGGESGSGARPMLPGWARSLRDQCQAAAVPFFFKQWGEWLDEEDATRLNHAPGPEMFDAAGKPTGLRWRPYDPADPLGGAMIRVGKRQAGRLLDGCTWDELPA